MPVKGRIKEFLTLENILNKVSDYDIYRFYLNHDFILNKAFNSPFRNEEHPSFSITFGKTNKLHHLDYGDSRFQGDCLNFVEQSFNLDAKRALEKIDNDLGLGFTNSPKKDYKTIISKYDKPPEVKSKTHLLVVTRRFNKDELAYWNQYHLSEDDLKENEVYAVSKIYKDRELLPSKANELTFAYKFGDKWKIYKPLARKEFKWLMSVANDTMSGLYRISEGDEMVVVTKGKKDEMVLSKFLPHVCSVQAENIAAINEENIKLFQSCGKTIINFDSDEPGILACKYYNQFGFGWINCPTIYKKPNGDFIKDFSDLARHYGMDAVMAYFKRKNII